MADPLFSPLDDKPETFDTTRARHDIEPATGAGDLTGEDARMRPVLARLDAILCAPTTPTCGVAREPTGLTAVGVGERPKLTGALDRASTVAQTLLLEYAEGKPMAEVGWGRATAGTSRGYGLPHARIPTSGASTLCRTRCCRASPR